MAALHICVMKGRGYAPLLLCPARKPVGDGTPTLRWANVGAYCIRPHIAYVRVLHTPAKPFARMFHITGVYMSKIQTETPQRGFLFVYPHFAAFALMQVCSSTVMRPWVNDVHHCPTLFYDNNQRLNRGCYRSLEAGGGGDRLGGEGEFGGKAAFFEAFFHREFQRYHPDRRGAGGA